MTTISERQCAHIYIYKKQKNGQTFFGYKKPDTLHNVMCTYLTDARLTTVTRREGYVSWGVNDLFLTPAHNWIHKCIRYWTREWDPALNTSAV